MDIITRFRCQICKTEYDRADNAMACERAHILPMDFKVQYGAMQQYPAQTILKMPDGSILIYRKVY